MVGGTDRGKLGDENGVPASSARSAATPASRPALRRIDSSGLLGGAREIEIDHGGELYRLRCTNKGKLILTK